ncbi:hypothetical protein FB45DRAFT_1022405 [Roridomyces roridus]|uniref:P-type ATPase A domain-containing protein n=1 Tax=Roridomyces roridus TaxID=1738132 RepID=A0AAD7FTA7_9AGAR|nr:hypothetical protein FB45DRAFT_1022405 [Roridomyces roridus]
MQVSPSHAIRRQRSQNALGALQLVLVELDSSKTRPSGQAMNSLRQLSLLTVIVMRDGQLTVVPANQVIPGDVGQIKAGDLVIANARLFIVSNLGVSEQLLTDKSIPDKQLGSLSQILAYTDAVVKFIETFKEADLPLGDRLNIYAMNDNKDDNSGLSFFSHIKEMILVYSGVRKGTPLQRKLTKLAYITEEVMIYAIAVAVGIVPESLIVILTPTMSLSTRRMAQRNVVVRKLDALENLGGVTDICTDKTGTLALGKMSVRKMWLVGDAKGYKLSSRTASDASEPVGDIHKRGDNGAVVDPDSIPAIRVASLCNVATIQQNDTGDPTEVTLQVLAIQ